MNRPLGNPDPRGQLSEAWEVMRQEKMGHGTVTLFELSAILKQVRNTSEGITTKVINLLMTSPSLLLFERGECSVCVITLVINYAIKNVSGGVVVEL